MKSPLNDALDRKWIEASATTTKLERDLAALSEQLAERDAEIARLKAHAEEMADAIERSIGYVNAAKAYRKDFPGDE